MTNSPPFYSSRIGAVNPICLGRWDDREGDEYVPSKHLLQPHALQPLSTSLDAPGASFDLIPDPHMTFVISTDSPPPGVGK